MSRSLRAVVVGLGVMGSNHCRVLWGMPDVELTAAVDPDAARRKAIAETHRGVCTHARFEDALAAHDLDIACIATPVEFLAANAKQAISHGLHVLVEKPTAATEAEAQELSSAVRTAGAIVSVGHVERFNPAVVLLKAKLAEGAIGRILQMHARRLSPFPKRELMIGAARDLATHDIDVMRFLSGSEVSRVYAETGRLLDGGVLDLVCATLRFEDDCTGLLEVNWITPTKVRQLSVTGERGMFVVDYVTQELTLFSHPTQTTDWDMLAGIRGGGEGDMVRFALARREPLALEWTAFVDAIRNGDPAPVGLEDGIAALSTAEAIERAGRAHELTVPDYSRRLAAGRR